MGRRTGCANFVLCLLPENGPDANAVAIAAREEGLFVRPVASMGRTLGARHLRIAVKDRVTNQRMKTILRGIVERRERDVPGLKPRPTLDERPAHVG